MPNASINPEELARVEALLPWFSNGSLNEADARWMREWLSAHADDAPEIHAELAWLQQTAQQVQSTVVVPDSERGLDVLLNRIHAEKTSAAQIKGSHASEKGLLVRLRHWLATPAVGMAFATLLLVQTGIIAFLWRSAPHSTNSPAGGNVPTQVDNLTPLSGGVSVPNGGALLQITFVPQATEANMRKTLNEVGASIVAGPGALGVYTVSVPVANVDKALKTLKDKNNVVESVTRP